MVLPRLCIDSVYESTLHLKTTSVIKVLPQVKEAPARVSESYRLMRARLTEDDGVLSASDRLRIGFFMLFQVSAVLLLACSGLFALYFKMDSLAFLFDIPRACRGLEPPASGLQYWPLRCSTGHLRPGRDCHMLRDSTDQVIDDLCHIRAVPQHLCGD